MDNVTLIIPTYRNSDYLDLCLTSAIENREDSDNKILVVVDGYMEESQAVLDKHPGVEYLDLGQNRGMQFALNAGVMQANTKYVFIINDDNVMPTDWDTRALEYFENRLKETDGLLDQHEIDNVCLTVNQVEPTGPGMFNFNVKDLGKDVQTFQYDNWLDYEASIAEPGTIEFTGHIFPFVIQKKHYLACGGFDVFYNSPNVCDWDFFLKLELLGFKFPRTKELHLYHFGSVATRKNSESVKFKQREAAAFAEYEWKWGTSAYNEPNTNSKVPPNRKFRGFND